MSEPFVPLEPVREPRFVDRLEQPTAVVRANAYPMADLPKLFDPAFQTLATLMGERAFTPVGPAFALYHSQPGETVDIEIGFPVESALEGPVERDDLVVEPSTIPAARAAVQSHFGGYDGLWKAWPSLIDWATAQGETPTFPFYEVYVTQPAPDSDPETLRTDLVLPVEPEAVDFATRT